MAVDEARQQDAVGTIDDVGIAGCEQLFSRARLDDASVFDPNTAVSNRTAGRVAEEPAGDEDGHEFIAAHTRSGVNGIACIRVPVAFTSALRMAGATPSFGISAMAFAPNGPEFSYLLCSKKQVYKREAVGSLLKVSKK